MLAHRFSRRLVTAFAATTTRRIASALALAAVSLTVVPTAAGAQADETVDVPFEDRDGIPASMVEFNGTANSANARWLVNLYDHAFARQADLGGLDHWLARITAGGETSRRSVARSFLNSTEGARNDARQSYTELLDREPDADGLVFWTNYLRTGSVNTLRFQHLASEEYFVKSGGSNEQYVKTLYFDLLGRDIDSGGFEFYVNHLTTGTPRWWVSRSIYESDESLGNRVTAYYRAILERDPTAAEIAEGVALVLGDDERAVQVELLGSDEAFDAFLVAALDS